MDFKKHFFGMIFNKRGETGGEAGGSGEGAGEGAGAGAGAGEGGVTPSWLDSLPEEARTDPNITKFKTSEDFYAGYKNQVEMIGKKGIIVPDANSTPEDKEKFLNALGRPSTQDGYKLETPQGLHESIKVTPESTAAFNAMAHKHGLTNEQANGLNQHLMQIVNQATVDMEKRDNDAVQVAETALRQKWGADYDRNKSLVSDGIMKVGGQEAIDAMGGENGLGNNPVVLDTLAKILSQLGEDAISNIAFKGTSEGNAEGNETAEQAQVKVKAMNEDKSNEWNKSLWDEKDPKHKEAVAERNRLYKIAYPSGGTV